MTRFTSFTKVINVIFWCNIWNIWNTEVLWIFPQEEQDLQASPFLSTPRVQGLVSPITLNLKTLLFSFTFLVWLVVIPCSRHFHSKSESGYRVAFGFYFTNNFKEYVHCWANWSHFICLFLFACLFKVVSSQLIHSTKSYSGCLAIILEFSTVSWACPWHYSLKSCILFYESFNSFK